MQRCGGHLAVLTGRELTAAQAAHGLEPWATGPNHLSATGRPIRGVLDQAPGWVGPPLAVLVPGSREQEQLETGRQDAARRPQLGALTEDSVLIQSDLSWYAQQPPVDYLASPVTGGGPLWGLRTQAAGPPPVVTTDGVVLTAVRSSGDVDVVPVAVDTGEVLGCARLGPIAPGDEAWTHHAETGDGVVVSYLTREVAKDGMADGIPQARVARVLARDGTVVWDAPAEAPMASALWADDTVVALAANATGISTDDAFRGYLASGSDQPRITGSVLDARTGELRWHTEMTPQRAEQVLAVSGGIVLIEVTDVTDVTDATGETGPDGPVAVTRSWRAVTASGEELWRIPSPGGGAAPDPAGDEARSPELDGAAQAIEARAAEGMFLVGQGGSLWGVAASTGTVQWRIPGLAVRDLAPTRSAPGALGRAEVDAAGLLWLPVAPGGFWVVDPDTGAYQDVALEYPLRTVSPVGATHLALSLGDAVLLTGLGEVPLP